MNESFEVRGRIRRIEQRTAPTSSFQQHPSHESFDVDFSPSGKILRITRYKNSGAVHAVELNSFDDSGNLVRVDFLDGEGNPTGSTHNHYGSDGQLASWVGIGADGQAIRRGENDLVDGRLMRSRTTLANGQPVVEREFTYTGALLTQKRSRFYGAEGNFSEQWIETYDSSGRLRETWGLAQTCKPLGDGRYRYEYDGEGRTTRVLSLDEWDTDRVPGSMWVIEYGSDEIGNWVERRKHFLLRSRGERSTTITKRTLSYWDD